MALVATRPVSLGDEVLERGEAVSPDLLRSLPVGRADILRRNGILEEVDTPAGEVSAKELADLKARVAKLERKLNTQPKRKAA